MISLAGALGTPIEGAVILNPEFSVSSHSSIGLTSRIGLRSALSWIPWGKRLLAIALILLMQGPAMLLQEIAWANMLVDYTRERGLKDGVVATFDGEHPCELCLKAQAIREDERKQESPERPGSELRLRMAWAGFSWEV